jgi:streptogramin lyase
MVRALLSVGCLVSFFANAVAAVELLVGSNSGNSVYRYDGLTGAFIDVFASGGGLSGPRGMEIGPDGHLYVANHTGNNVIRYDGATGAFIDVFASGGGLSGDQVSMVRRAPSSTSSPRPRVWIRTVCASGPTATCMSPTG